MLIAPLFKVAAALGLLFPLSLFSAAGFGPLKTRTDPPPTPKQEQIIQWIASYALPLKSVTAGSGFEDLQPLANERMVLPDAFDGLIFIENTTHARPNPTGLRPGTPRKPWWKFW